MCAELQHYVRTSGLPMCFKVNKHSRLYSR